jgi:hypothetical protein
LEVGPVEGVGDFRVQGHFLSIMIIAKVEIKHILTLKDEEHPLLGGRHNETVLEFKLSRT